MARDYTRGLQGLAPMRRRAGFTQYALAEALGVDRGRLANWENGIWPSAGWLPKLADLLCCGIDELYEAPPEESIAQDGGQAP